jgi:hypothetical protein
VTLGALLPYHAPRSIRELEAEPTSTISEADLLAGYVGAVVVRSCSCGGWIRAREVETSIAHAVAAHNATAIHESWAIAAGYRDA